MVDRELRLRARQPTTYWARCGLAAIAALVAAQVVELSSGALNPALIGQRTFEWLRWLGFVAACLSALVTADCLSGERREGTLGLLFLTNLKSREVVFGKLSAASLSALFGLVSFMPALALAFMAGGVMPGEVARSALALLNALFISLAAGLWVSAGGEGQLKTLRNALLFVSLMFVWTWVAGHASPLLPALLSPYGAFLMAPAAAIRSAAPQFWCSLAVEHAEAWLLLGAAISRLNRKWREPEKPEPPKTAALKRPIQLTPKVVTDEDRALLEAEPICWAVSRTQGHNLYVWAGTLLMLLGGGTILLGSAPFMVLNLGSSLAAGILLSWGAGRSLFTARRSGELELMLTTPLGARDIVRGHWWALWRPMRGAWLLAVFLMVMQFIYLSSWGFGVIGAVLTPLNKVLDAVALCWVAMAFAVKARKPFQVILWTVGIVILLPWMVASVLSVAVPALNPSAHALRLRPLTAMNWLVAFPLFYLAKNISLIWWALRSLRTELRATAPLAAGDWLK